MLSLQKKKFFYLFSLYIEAGGRGTYKINRDEQGGKGVKNWKFFENSSHLRLNYKNYKSSPGLSVPLE